MRLALLAAALGALPMPDAAAHSLLLASTPAAGAVTSVAPPRVTLRFNNRIEKALSKIRLVRLGGDTRDLVVAVAEGPPETLIASLPPLAPGQYRVEWQVLSSDGHVVSGGFPFRLGS